MSQLPQTVSPAAEISVDYLSGLMPLANLEPERLTELSKHIRIKSLPAGTTLFARGDDNQIVYYLLDGEMDLQVNTANTTLAAASPQASQPIDPHNPRHFTAVTRTPVKIIEIDSDLLDIFVARNYRDLYFSSKLKNRKSKDSDDMDAVLRSKIFQMIPPVNVQILLEKFEEVPVLKNQIIFRQESRGDYYYLIKSGSCAVLKYESPKDGWHVVADLGPGAGFGEEALISEKNRNATVIMSSDGVLLRLSRGDFDKLIKAPVVKTVQYDNAMELINNGAIVIDVNETAEAASDLSLSETIPIPMRKLRTSLDRIPVNRPLVIRSDNEQRSACAAYILIAHGFEALVLRN
ncbi:MAG: cyclic nucleotide-binding domain-containing protein [Gammaproteobacteria bacterium]|nr:cyclic nucleotide-binding domain-containing protein [Gammaproteobacteria bacterium]